MTIALLAAILFGLTIIFQKEKIVNPLEWHHLYLGLVVAVIGYLIKSPFFVVVGDCFAVDDAVQHFIQAAFYPAFVSPLHWLFTKLLWPMPVIQKISAFLNSLF